MSNPSSPIGSALACRSESVYFPGVLFFLSLCCLSSLSRAEKAPDLVRLSPFKTTIDNVALEIPRKAYVQFDPTTGLLRLRLRASLKDVEQQVASVVFTENGVQACSKPGTNSALKKVETARMYLNASDQISVEVRGTSIAWTCLENPVPSSTVTWVAASIGPGITTKVPQVSAEPGTPIKVSVQDAPFNASFSIHMLWSGFGVDTKYALSPMPPNIDPAFFTQIANKMTYLTNPILAQSTVLSKILSFTFKIDNASFVSEDRHIESQIDMSTHVEPADFVEFGKILDKL